MFKLLKKNIIQFGLFSLCGFVVVLILFLVGHPSLANAATCHSYTDLSETPAGFGSPVDVFSSGLAMEADCNSNNLLDVAVNTFMEHQIVYSQGYIWDGNQWQAISYSGSNYAGSDNWIEGKASTTISPNQDASFFATYVCTWDEERWKCGCRDQECSGGSGDMWQIQGFDFSVAEGDDSNTHSSERASGSGLAASCSKFIGNLYDLDLSNESFSDFQSYWNQLTPENEGKWSRVEPNRDNYIWGGNCVNGSCDLDRLYDHAKNENLPFRYHTLIWGNGGSGEPNWLENLSDAKVREEIKERMQKISERYPDIDQIDVVNEPLHQEPEFKDAIGGDGETGWDWVVWTFEQARNYFPNAKLLVNDYGILGTHGNQVSDYLEIINILNQRGLIDGIGVQGHALSDNKGLSVFEENLDELASVGLPIYVTELDISGSSQEQLDQYQKVFPIIWEHPGVDGITLWGYRKDDIWRHDAYLVDENGNERPAMRWLKEYVPSSPPCQ